MESRPRLGRAMFIPLGHGGRAGAHPGRFSHRHEGLTTSGKSADRWLLILASDSCPLQPESLTRESCFLPPLTPSP